ncbi:MAG: hypothetical protein MZV49_13135 [Rhodopseudomonas palustris]|nr:hypothetical protein [Rhodopseudomonas palustris]
MYTLYYSPGTASMVVHLALLEIGAPHRLEKVDFELTNSDSPGVPAPQPARAGADAGHRRQSRTSSLRRC